MRVIFDHCTPASLRHHLPDHNVSTARQMGWQTFQNGALVAAAIDEGFDAFVTADQNIPYQLNLAILEIAVIVLTSNHRPSVVASAAVINRTISETPQGQAREVSIPYLRRT